VAENGYFALNSVFAPALNGLYCADMPLSNYSLTHSSSGTLVFDDIQLGSVEKKRQITEGSRLKLVWITFSWLSKTVALK